MYSVSAQTNDVGIIKVPLNTTSNFSLDPEQICSTLSSNPQIKMIYITSPGNPTANLIRKTDLLPLLNHPTWNGLVVLDEAYIDFSPPNSSLAEYVLEFPNLVVLQTLSKAFGLAGIRLGVAFAAPPVARLLNSLKAPYNISNPTSELAQQALSPQGLAVMEGNVRQINSQRQRLLEGMPRIPGVGRFLGGAEANFLLVEMLDSPGGRPSNEVALAVYERLAESRGVVVRFRGKEVGCLGCLRVTVGTEGEVTRFLRELESVLEEIYAGKGGRGIAEGEEVQKEREANDVVS